MVFSQIEKKLIKEMIISKGLASLENLLDSHLKDGYNIYVDAKTSKIWFDNNIDSDTAILESKKLYRLTISILFLLDNLERHKLIYTMKINSGIFPKNFGKCNTSQTHNTVDLFDDLHWLGLFEHYLNREILPSEDLISLLDNNFLTEEEKKFSKQYWVTWAGIILAFAGAITSPFIQNVLEDKSQKECNCSIKINHESKISIDKNDSIFKRTNAQCLKK